MSIIYKVITKNSTEVNKARETSPMQKIKTFLN